MPQWDVVVLGGINTDYLIRGRELPGPGMSLNGSVFLQAPGGKGANAAVAASRLGARTAIIGRVGNDPLGESLIEHLTRAGVHAVHVSGVAALATTALGAQTALPRRHELEMFLENATRARVPRAEFVAGAFTPQEVLQEHMKDAEQIVARAAQRLSRSGISVDTAVRQGDPRAVIVDEAAEWNADLIVVGSHGHTGLTRLLLGSVAQHVVAHAPSSVEVVRRRRPAGAGEG